MCFIWPVELNVALKYTKAVYLSVSDDIIIHLLCGIAGGG
jgi:hypothetical protein